MSIDKKSSEIPGFYKLNPQERIDLIKKYCDLDELEIKQIISMLGLTIDQADKMIENAIGGISIPLGIATRIRAGGLMEILRCLALLLRSNKTEPI